MPRNDAHACRMTHAPLWHAAQGLMTLHVIMTLLAMLSSAPLRAQTTEPRNEVVVITSYDTLPYRDALAGLRQVLQSADRSLRTMTLNEDGSLAGGVAQRSGASLTVTLGARAANAVAAGGAPPALLLPCMMISSASRPGVLLEHSPDARIALLRQVMPAAQTIGTLYSTDRPPAEIAALREAARRAGVQLVATRVDLNSPLERQLDALGNDIDVLLATFDLGVFAPRNAQPLLLFSYRQRIPLLGLSDAWTRAGALLSTDWDYTDIGRQCGEAALQMLQSGTPLPQNVAPRRMVYSLNRSAARYFRQAISERLAREARQVFE